MSDLNLRTEGYSLSLPGSTYWNAVWGGLFTFIGIWLTFEVLGMAIFSAPHTGSEVALGFWSVILSAIAMLIAGRQTGSCVRLSGHSDGRRHGMIMFGLTVTSTVVLMKLGSMLLIGFPGINAAARGSDFMNIFTASGWVTFAALFVGFLGAIIGAMLGERSKTQEHIEPREIRPAA